MLTLPRQDSFTAQAKKALIDRNQTVTGLARQLGFARNTVSMAINHPILPTVREKIAAELGISKRK